MRRRAHQAAVEAPRPDGPVEHLGPDHPDVDHVRALVADAARVGVGHGRRGEAHVAAQAHPQSGHRNVLEVRQHAGEAPADAVREPLVHLVRVEAANVVCLEDGLVDHAPRSISPAPASSGAGGTKAQRLRARSFDVGSLLRKRRTLLLSMAAALVALLAPAAGQAATYPVGFSEQTVFSGLTNPTAVRFASDGRVFVAEKSGRIKVFDSLSDPQPDLFADLRTQVHNFWDRGLLGLALDPSFPDSPHVYVLYTHDAAIGGTAPRWGAPGATSDGCPNPPGATADGCVVSGRLSRLKSSTGAVMSKEEVMIEDWCQQYPSHSVGALEHDRWGMLWASGGDGASFGFADWGQEGNPTNPCGD